MEVLDGIIAWLKLDEPLRLLAPGGLWTGMAPAASSAVGPETQPAGEQPQDYVIVTPLSDTPRRSSTSNLDENLIQITAHCHDRGDGADALAAARAIIRRCRLLLLESDAWIQAVGDPETFIVGISASSQNYVQAEDLGWIGQLDIAVRTQRSRVPA